MAGRGRRVEGRRVGGAGRGHALLTGSGAQRRAYTGETQKGAKPQAKPGDSPREPAGLGPLGTGPRTKLSFKGGLRPKRPVHS